MATFETKNPYPQLRRLEAEPHVRAAKKWLKQERKKHYGALCLPLDDRLYLTAKGFALHAGTGFDILPPIPDSYPLLRLSRRRVGSMKDLRDNFERRQEQRNKVIRNIATQKNIRYVGALEIPTFATLASYAAYLLFPPTAPVIWDAIEMRLLHRWRWFEAGPIQDADPILARAGCKPGRTATTKQLTKAFFGA